MVLNGWWVKQTILFYQKRQIRYVQRLKDIPRFQHHVVSISVLCHDMLCSCYIFHNFMWTWQMFLLRFGTYLWRSKCSIKHFTVWRILQFIVWKFAIRTVICNRNDWTFPAAIIELGWGIQQDKQVLSSENKLKTDFRDHYLLLL